MLWIVSQLSLILLFVRLNLVVVVHYLRVFLFSGLCVFMHCNCVAVVFRCVLCAVCSRSIILVYYCCVVLYISVPYILLYAVVCYALLCIGACCCALMFVAVSYCMVLCVVTCLHCCFAACRPLYYL